MTTTSVAVDALTELIAERQKFEGWIGALDERADSVPQHILVRVREDYANRLRGVIGKLGEFAPDLREAIGGLEQRLTASVAAIGEREEARIEGELRSAVGEYEPGQWEDIRNGLDSELSALQGERDALESELSELRTIYTQVAPEPGGVDVQDGVDPGATQPMRRAFVETESQPVPVPAADVRQPSAPMDAAAQAPGEAPIIQEDRNELLNELSSFASQSVPSTGESAVEPAGDSSEAQDGTKTLRCQECGALNYPTEWYCERCGGELATI